MADGNSGGTPATAGPVSNVGGAVATGQGTGPGGDAGTGTPMAGPEGQFAQAPAFAKLGPDGEPEPVGNAAQRAAGAAVAATFNSKVKAKLQTEARPESHDDPVQKISELEKELAELRVVHGQEAPKADQGELANQRAEEMAKQREEGDPNLAVKVKINGQGTVEPPK